MALDGAGFTAPDRRVHHVSDQRFTAGPRSIVDVPDVIAAIDIGTNSVHMVVARVSGAGRFEVITRHKEMVRLGSGKAEMKELLPEAIDRGVAALDRCRRIASKHDAQLVAVATSAVREAGNASVFIERALLEAGVVVDVISGFEEARLIHLGVLQSLPVYDSTILLCDIGGGSTELLFGRGDDILSARSLKLGAIRMSQRFFPNGTGTESEILACRRFIRDAIAPFRQETRVIDASIMVGSSGTIETMVAMTRPRGATPKSFNAEVLSRADLIASIDRLAAAQSIDDICALPGVDSSRADILLGGALILHEVMEAFDHRELRFSEAALREGVLLDALRRAVGGSATRLSDLRRESVLHLMELCEEDPDHAISVARLARDMFVALAPDLGLADGDAELLEAAALLANVGLFISHSGHHQHSYYVIRNSEHLMGFTNHEIELIAQVARYHRKSNPSDRHEPFAALKSNDRWTVRALSGILRVAIGLDRSHRGLVGRLNVAVTNPGASGDGQSERLIEIDVRRAAGVEADAEDLALEVYSADQRTGLLMQCLSEAAGAPCVIRINQIDDRPHLTSVRLE